jgi:hypothetical protein
MTTRGKEEEAGKDDRREGRERREVMETEGVRSGKVASVS